MDNQAAVGLEEELEMHKSKWKELKERGEKFLLEVKKGILDLEFFRSMFNSLEREKIGIENEVKVLKQGTGELEKKVTDFGNQQGAKSVVDLTDDEEDRIAQLMIENNVLECEKKAAESVAEDFKSKCKRLEMEILALKEEIPLSNMGSQERKGELRDHSQRVRKHLTFGDEVSTFAKMAPSTPGIGRAKRFRVVLSDSEDDQDGEDDQSHRTNVHKPDFVLLKNDIGNKDGISNSPCASTHKRRRVSTIVDSDLERENDDDNIPIHKLFSQQVEREQKGELSDFDLNEGVKEKSSPRRCLVRKYDKKDEELEYDEDDTASSTGNGSSDGFIDNRSDISESDATSGTGKVSDDDVDYKEVISQIRRKKEIKGNWEFEADLLAELADSIELCMKAVCVLYRKQTQEEQWSKETIFRNRRGFSQCDASRGSKVAEFLCGGKGDLCKTVKELCDYDPEGPELCRKLASRYSKQLFEIYKNKEDPFWP